MKAFRSGWVLFWMLLGCEQPSAPKGDDAFVPFEGADVVKPEEADQKTPVDQFIVQQLKRYASQVPPSLCVGTPRVLWTDGHAPNRKGVVVVSLARGEVYRQAREFRLQGPTEKILSDLMQGVGGQLVNAHRIPSGSNSRVDLASGSLAQAAYAALKSAGISGRILNANRWVIGAFVENASPVEAFRPIFDHLWEACDALRESTPVLHVGEQVLGEDDIRLKRLYQKAGQQVQWPSYAGSAPDPGLEFGPSAQ